MTKLGISIGACIVAVGVVAIVSATAGSERLSSVSDEEILDRVELEVTPEMKLHSRINNILWITGVAWTLLACGTLVWTGLATRVRDGAEKLSSKRFVQRTLAAFGILSCLTVLLFPLELVGGFIVPHYFDLSNQTFLQWIGEGLKGFMLAVGVGSLLTAAAFEAIDRFPRRWWLVIWGASVPLSLALVFVAPILIAPLFNKFERLEDRGLESRLLDLAEGVGIEGSRVYQVDKSKQTKTLNAYVTGIGSSKRIVIWDTLLEKMSEDEIVFVMAHEMGHYVKHHLWRGLAYSALGSLILYFVISRLIILGVQRWSGRWNVRGVSDVAILPWALLVATLIGFLSSPATAALSRGMEHEADVFALEQTNLTEAGAAAFATLADNARVDPSPPPIVKFWRYSHPPLIERMRLALEWDERHPEPRL